MGRADLDGDAAQRGGESVELGRYWRVLVRRWYVVACCCALGVLAGLGYLLVAPHTYTATTVVNINAISSQPFENAKPDSQLIDPSTEAQLATSAPVLGRVARELGTGSTVGQMRKQTQVTPVTNATVVRISFEASSPSVATRGADLVADAYLAYRSEAAVRKIDMVLQRLKTRQAALRRNLVDTNRLLSSGNVGNWARVEARSNRQMINFELSTLLTQINQFDSVDTSGGTLISDAAHNPVRPGPSRRLGILVPGLAGTLVGLVLAFVVNAVDRRVRDRRDLQEAANVPVLAELRSAAAFELEAADDDTVRSLREQLLARMEHGAGLVVTDLTSADDPSDVGAALAAAVAEATASCRLVLAEHPPEFVSRLSSALQLEPAGRFAGGSVLASDHVPGLSVVTLGDDGDRGDVAARYLGQMLRSSVDGPSAPALTIVCLPPTAPRSLRLSAMRLCPATIAVVNRLGTTTTAVEQLRDEAAVVDGEVLGCVLTARKRHERSRPTPWWSRRAVDSAAGIVRETRVHYRPAMALPGEGQQVQ